jgi:hypothetical protein
MNSTHKTATNTDKQHFGQAAGAVRVNICSVEKDFAKSLYKFFTIHFSIAPKDLN